jgi:hypothetical protein
MRFLACLALCTLLPSLTLAQDDEANLTGLTFGAGLGYANPFGDMFDESGTDASLDSVISGLVPLSVSAGYRSTPLISLGLALQYAPAITKNCPPGSTCSAHDTYLGAEFRLHGVPEQSFSPSIALGVGYEWLGLSKDSTDFGIDGWVFGVEASGDMRVTRSLTLGPYLGLRVGRYGSVNFSADIPDENQAAHVWFALGLRGAFTLSPPHY